MKLSKLKKITNEFDGGVFALYQTLIVFRDTFDFSEKNFNVLNAFINLLEDEIYTPLCTEKDVELFDEKYFVEKSYKEIL